jgi:RNA polymerase sigma factor (sigma-70 family)
MAAKTEVRIIRDVDALAALYEREWSSLVRIALLLTNSRPLAEEIAQDAFVRLQTTSTTVLNPPAYLRTVVVNACRDVHRHQGVVQRTPLPRPEPARAEFDELFDALAQLPWRQQAALTLRFHVDLPETEIAAILRCRPSTVRSITRRALATLRKDLGE